MAFTSGQVGGLLGWFGSRENKGTVTLADRATPRRGGVSRCSPRVLFIGSTCESGASFADLASEHGCVGIPLPVAEVPFIDRLAQADAVLLLADLSTSERSAICRFLRAHEAYRTVPVAAVLGLADSPANLGVDAVLRLPVSRQAAVSAVCQMTSRSADGAVGQETPSYAWQGA